MRPIVELRGSLLSALEEQAEALSDHLRGAVQRVSLRLQDTMRGQVRSAGLGEGLSKAWQREVYPRSKRRTFHPAALIYSKSAVLHAVFDRGATIVPRRGRYLVIPLPEAVKRNLHTTRTSRKGGSWGGSIPRRASMLAEAAQVLGARVVSARPGGAKHRGGAWKPYILLATSKAGPQRLIALWHHKQGEPAIPLFVLVRQVTLSPRLDLKGAADSAGRELAASVGGSA